MQLEILGNSQSRSTKTVMAGFLAPTVATSWVGLITGSWVEASAGNGYTFGFYSPVLKTVLQYTQSELNNLGFAKDIGDNVGLPSGWASSNWSPWMMLVMGALHSFAGYGVLWLVASERIAPLPFWQMCIAICVGANSSTWLDTAALVTCLKNFPTYRGMVTGVLKGSYGLSSAIFTLLYTVLFTDDAASFLLLVAVGPAVVCLLAMPFLHITTPQGTSYWQQGAGESQTENRRFMVIQAIFILLALFLMGVVVAEDAFAPITAATHKLFAGTVLAFLLFPLIIPGKMFIDYCRGGRTDPHPHLRLEQQSSTQSLRPKVDERVRSAEDFMSLDGERPCGQSQSIGCITQATSMVGGSQSKERSSVGPKLGQDFTLTQAMVSMDYWLLFLVFFFGLGSGITAINNLGQMGEAQGYPSAGIFISLVSIWNSLGRLGAGALSEYYLRYSATHRLKWLLGAQALMLISHLLFASAFPISLYVGSIILGVSYGAHFSILVPTASELFGLQNFGMHYNFLSMSIPLGSYLFSGLLAGFLYDRETTGGETCYGAHCFRSTFVLMAGMCLIGGLLNFVVIHRTGSVYRTLYGLANDTTEYCPLPNPADS